MAYLSVINKYERELTKKTQTVPFFFGNNQEKTSSIQHGPRIIDLFSFNSNISLDNTGSIFSKESSSSIKFNNASSGKNLYLSGIDAYCSLSRFQSNTTEDSTTFDAVGNIGDGSLHIWDMLWRNEFEFNDSDNIVTSSFSAPDLTRYEDGNGLSLWVSCKEKTKSLIQRYNFDIEITYNNQDNISKTVYFTFNDVNNNDSLYSARNIFPIPLTPGDTGVRKVSKIIIKTSTTISSLNPRKINFFIGKYYGCFSLDNQISFKTKYNNYLNGLQKVHNNACLTFAVQYDSNKKRGIFVDNDAFLINRINIMGNLLLSEI